jgi:hypothetical protein
MLNIEWNPTMPLNNVMALFEFRMQVERRFKASLVNDIKATRELDIKAMDILNAISIYTCCAKFKGVVFRWDVDFSNVALT